MKEFYTHSEFIKYLNKLDEDKPFDCLLLRKLPEEVYTHEGSGYRYEPGTLICIAKPGNIGIVPTHRCGLSRTSMVLDESGELEAMCSWNGSTFKLGIKSFSPRRWG